MPVVGFQRSWDSILPIGWYNENYNSTDRLISVRTIFEEWLIEITRKLSIDYKIDWMNECFLVSHRVYYLSKRKIDWVKCRDV